MTVMTMDETHRGHAFGAVRQVIDGFVKPAAVVSFDLVGHHCRCCVFHLVLVLRLTLAHVVVDARALLLGSSGAIITILSDAPFTTTDARGLGT